MPELPEVENIKRQINEKINSEKIQSVSVFNRILRKPINDSFENDLEGNNIQPFQRFGKYLVSELNDNNVLLIHLGMTGNIRISNDFNKRKHDIFYLKLDSKYIIYSDIRRFGMALTLSMNEALHIVGQGLEPFDKKLTPKYLLSLFKYKNINIKTALMKQDYIRGIGNIYASEILFKSKIHPLSKVSNLTEKQLEEIILNTRLILTESINSGGTSFSDYHHTDGSKGGNVVNLKVYQKEGELCSVCLNPIRMIEVSQRSTFYCYTCQKEY